MKILTGAQFKELDQYTIKNEPISAIDLMERAAKAIAEEVSTRWSLKTHFYIFAGPGNNGGDALAVARLLAEKGYKATVYLFNINQKLSEECAFNKECLAEYSNIKFIEVHDQFTFPNIEEKDVIIDGLFGTGLNKPLNGGFASLAQSINKTNVPIVSIDIPSGLMCEDNTYNDMNTVVRATLTLTIQLPKMAFLFPENQKYIGELKVLDIQLDMKYMENVATNMYLLESDMACKLLKKRHAFAHKGNMGHALVVAGSFGMAGASIFCAKACMKAGAGKVTIHTPKMNNDILQIAVPEAILSHDLDDDIITGSIETGSFNALVIGPGIGKSETAIELVKRGHRLIADDAVEIKKVSAKTLVGAAPELIRHYVELRGIGIVDVRRIFGMGAVKLTEKIDLIINLEPWQQGKFYERVGLDTEYTNIMGIDVPSVTVPVKPGRNLAVIIEIAAMNNRQKKMGYNTAVEFNKKLMGQFDDSLR